MATGDAYQKSSLTLIDEGPSLQAPLGYNEIGQNIFLRLAKATQTSLIVGFLSVILIGIIGAAVGSHRRLLRRLGRQPADAHRRRRPVAAVPGPRPAHRVVLGHPRHPGHRLRHRLRRLDDRGQARPGGVPAAARDGLRGGRQGPRREPRRIILRHMLPGAMAPLVVALSLGVADAIIGESALSFLGFGIAPPEISLGQMLQNYREYFYSNSERILYPALVLIAIVLSRQLPRRRPA